MADYDVGNALCSWMAEACHPNNAKKIAKSVGYNDSPLFNAEKKKIKLMQEIVILHTAFVIDTVNKLLPKEAKPIIDSFLECSKKSIFDPLEKKGELFKLTYEQRIAEYFKIFGEEKASLGISFLFMQSLDIDPLSNINNQLNFINELAGILRSCTECVKSIQSAVRMKATSDANKNIEGQQASVEEKKYSQLDLTMACSGAISRNRAAMKNFEANVSDLKSRVSNYMFKDQKIIVFELTYTFGILCHKFVFGLIHIKELQNDINFYSGFRYMLLRDKLYDKLEYLHKEDLIVNVPNVTIDDDRISRHISDELLTLKKVVDKCVESSNTDSLIMWFISEIYGGFRTEDKGLSIILEEFQEQRI